MANTGFKGVDVRQTGNQLVFRAFLQSSAGALIVAGTTNFYIIELQSDGTIKTYDFNDNTFKTTACTTENLAGAYKKSNNAATDTGLWTAVLSTLTGFTAGSVYFVRVNNSTASPTDQIREFQYGSVEGDLVVTQNGTGVAELNVDVKMLNGLAAAAANLGAVYAAFETGTAQAGAASSITLRSGSSANNNQFLNQAIFILSGTGAGQTNRITGYTGSSKIATVETTWVTNPDATSVYFVLGRIG